MSKQLYDEEQDLDIEIDNKGAVYLVPNIEAVQRQGSLVLSAELMEEIVSAWLETREPGTEEQDDGTAYGTRNHRPDRGDGEGD